MGQLYHHQGSLITIAHTHKRTHGHGHRNRGAGGGGGNCPPPIFCQPKKI